MNPRGAPVCKFYASGVCTAGSKCRFRHVRGAHEDNVVAGAFRSVQAPAASIPTLCKYVSSRNGCRLGGECPFYHSLYESDERERRERHARLAASEATPPAAAAERAATRAPAPPPPAEQPDVEEEREGQWVLPGEEDPSYFYGAPGAAPDAARGPGERRPSKWSAIAGRHATDEAPPSPAPDAPPRSASNAPVCVFFRQGSCRYGDGCRFRHDASPAAEAAEPLPPTQDEIAEAEAAASQEAECGICLEAVQGAPGEGHRPGRRFGVLPGCAHGFCLECIRTWRGAGAETATACPLCREVSHFVVPSQRLVRQPDRKARLIAEYLASLRRIPCAYFQDGKGVCPFGSSCFYYHRYPGGREADRGVRLLQGLDHGEREGGRGTGGGVGGGVRTRVDRQGTSLGDWLG